MEIKETSLSQRSKEILIRMGVENTETLAKTTEKELIKARGMGNRSFQEIKEFKMENNIVDVEFKEIEALEDKSNEILAAETNNIYNQMELVGVIGIQLAAQAGERLNIIKERLPHGQWESWAKDNLNFSLRKAKNMMQLSRKMGDEKSIFSKRQTFADIGISKVYALLGTDEEVAEKVLENPEAGEVSVREFKAQIKALEDEKRKMNAENEQLKDKEASTEQEMMRNQLAMKELRIKVDELEKELNNTAETDPDDLIALTEKLEETEKQLAEEKEKSNKLIESQREQLEKSVAEAREKIVREKEAADLEKQEQYELQLKELEKRYSAKIDKLKEDARKLDKTELVEFKIKSNMLQSDFNDCLKTIEHTRTESPEQAEKMKNALAKVMQVMISRM